MCTRIKRRFDLDTVRVEIEEILTPASSGEITQHGTHLWPSSVVLAAALHRMGVCRGKRVLELGCGCGLPGLVAAYSAVDTILTDGYQEGMAAARHSIATNVLPNPIRVEKLEWGDPDGVAELNLNGGLDVILAADCLYPDVAGWPSFFYTVAVLLRDNPRAALFMTFHKRNSFCSIDPFIKHWKMSLEQIPLSSIDLDDEEDIGGTALPGPNTGSIQLYRITSAGSQSTVS